MFLWKKCVIRVNMIISVRFCVLAIIMALWWSSVIHSLIKSFMNFNLRWIRGVFRTIARLWRRVIWTKSNAILGKNILLRSCLTVLSTCNYFNYISVFLFGVFGTPTLGHQLKSGGVTREWQRRRTHPDWVGCIRNLSL